VQLQRDLNRSKARQSLMIENSATFGNYFIHGIDEIAVPQAVSWWPSTIGWKLVAVLLIAMTLLKLLRYIKHGWKNRYRREALRQLAALSESQQLAALPHYLKVTALQAYSREQVAGLSGQDWLTFLDAHCEGVSFSSEPGKRLLEIAYAPSPHQALDSDQVKQLIQMSCHWIRKHV